MSALERIRKRLAERHGIVLPEDTELCRTYAGRWGKAAGSWSWFLFSPSTSLGLGSQWAATDLLRCRSWDIDEPRPHITPDRSIEVCPECLHGRPCRGA